MLRINNNRELRFQFPVLYDGGTNNINCEMRGDILILTNKLSNG